MSRKSGSNSYEYIVRSEEDLADEISSLKVYSQKINEQLREQKKHRNGLEQYLEAGSEALKKTNAVLNDILGTRSLFGCNTCILFGIIILVIMGLIII